MNKISVIGAGNVGTATARSIATRELCREVALIDIKPGLAEGNALDIQESAPLLGFHTRVRGYASLDAMRDSGLVIITAGYPRKPGMTRSDVLSSNIPIVYGIADHIAGLCPRALVLVVTNPVDPLTWLLWKRLRCSRQQIVGLGGVLDTSRMASFIALETGLAVQGIRTLVLGGHGDQMLPLPRFSSINGIPLEVLMDQNTLEAIVERTRFAGAEILEQRKFSAHETPAAAITTMVASLVRDYRSILPCVAVLEGEYGLREIAMSVPVCLGKNGIENIIELSLHDEEQAVLARSAESIRADLANAGSA